MARDDAMIRNGLLLATWLAAIIQPLEGRAQVYAGYLNCAVGRGVYPVLGAYRHLECDYVREAQPIETYSGYTGIVGVDPVASAPWPLVFQVFSDRPKSYAELQGRYGVSYQAKADQDGQPFLSIVLRGGRDGGVLLQLTPGPSTPLTVPNTILGLAQLQLDYREEKAPRQRNQAED